jgi:protein-disulfide isomerase
VKHVFFDLPLESIHKNAFKAAEAARCAGEQEKFWEMHDRLYANQQTLDQWRSHAEAVGLDVAKFEECMNSERQATKIRADMAEGQKAGINGTPAFFLAYPDPKSTKVTTVIRLSGAQPYSAFKTAIDKLLAGPPEAPKDKGAEK